MTEKRQKRLYDLLNSGILTHAWLAYTLFQPEQISKEAMRSKFHYKLNNDAFTYFELELIDKILDETFNKTGKLHKVFTEKNVG